jgi:hypothetical protein
VKKGQQRGLAAPLGPDEHPFVLENLDVQAAERLLAP